MALYHRLRLINGTVRHLNQYAFSPSEALDKFTREEDPYDGDFVATVEQTDVARRHIVEVYEVELHAQPAPIDDNQPPSASD